MNTLLKLINGWAEKLTINVLKLTGTSTDGINNVTAALTARDNATTDDQKTLAENTISSIVPKWFKTVKYVFIAVLVLGSGFLLYKLIKKHKIL